MNIKSLSIKDYQSFLNEAGASYNFMQSPEFVMSYQEREDVQIYGGLEDGKVIYAVIVIFRPALKFFSYASSPREWISLTPELMQNEKLLKEFVEGVSKILKSKKSLVWLVESNVEYQPRDKNGEPVKGIFFNEPYRQMIKNLGFILSSLWRGYDEARQSRWVSWIDLQKGLPSLSQGFPICLKNDYEMFTWEELIKEMSGNTRRSFQKADLPYLEYKITRGDQDPDLKEFDELLEMSAEKHNFETGSEKNRLEMLKSFGPHGYLCVSYLNISSYEYFLKTRDLELINKEKEALEVCEKMPNSKKKRNQLLEIQEQINHNQKELNYLNELKNSVEKNKIPLAGGVFYETPGEMVYLSGGSRPDLAKYMGPYVIQKAMIHMALEHNLRRYNFWGISGNFKPDEQGYGVFYFKKNLGATVGEYCGEFIKVLNPVFGPYYLKKIRAGKIEE
ncbi:peptidoglycan bridge formation glycyltransferase FemA/FemB family protein [Ileibacterium valens]|uniref:peptidoglycan bridge formation glycyltransferase FemA/FemB family protein n=2 Tax=Ileibacterium valens TaxID=1862668 RepID=UPI002573DD37|nr:peptidoglycan bridge formation glycyltransferase FemA/FemB family protein [Ileibacterium valens]